MNNSMPISLDQFLDYTPADFEEVDKEILRVTKKVPAKYVGISSSADGDKHKCLELVEKEDRDWSVWLLVDQTEFGDHDYYFHTEEAGSGSFILITNGKTPDDIDLDETGEGVLSLSTQWNSSYSSGKVPPTQPTAVRHCPKHILFSSFK